MDRKDGMKWMESSIGLLSGQKVGTLALSEKMVDSSSVAGNFKVEKLSP